MKRLFLLSLCFMSMGAFAQWNGGGWNGGGWNGGGNNGGWNFNGEGSNNGGSIGEYKSKKDLDYVGDNHIGHKLDVYFPKDDGKEKHNVIIHIYGSAWGSNNSKGSADLGTVGVAALKAGYIFVTPNHRTYNDALYPAQINDIKAVVRYLRGNAEELGIDTSFIGISGFSSGGHLASLMGVTRGVKTYTVGSATMDIEGNLGKYTNESSWVDAVCDWSGPVDCRYKSCGNPIQMAPEDDMVGKCNVQQCPDKHALLGANTFIDPDDAPTMVCHGSTDNIVPQCEGKMFYDNLENAGVECVYYPHGGGHGVAGDYTDEMIEFFEGIRKKKLENQASVKAIDAVASQGLCFDNDKVYICEGSCENCTYILTDVLGKVLSQGVLNDNGINISQLSKGIYVIRLSSGKTLKFSK